jgi:hypothetical protein
VRDEIIRPKESKAEFQTSSSAHKRNGFPRQAERNPHKPKTEIAGKVEALPKESYKPSPRFPYGVIRK